MAPHILKAAVLNERHSLEFVEQVFCHLDSSRTLSDLFGQNRWIRNALRGHSGRFLFVAYEIRCRWLRVCYSVKQVSSWRSVWVLYSLICVLALQEGSEGAKARCGRELVADLEFVCGDRGFYRGESRCKLTSIVWVKPGEQCFLYVLSCPCL